MVVNACAGHLHVKFSFYQAVHLVEIHAVAVDLEEAFFPQGSQVRRE